MRRLRDSIGQQWSTWVVPILILVLWQVLGQIGLIGQDILPTPLEVLQAFIQLGRDGVLWKT